jgi:hypothetical protein
MVQAFKPPFNHSDYWEGRIYPHIWVERLEEPFPSPKDVANLDYFSIKIDGDEADHPLPDDYAKYTMEQLKFGEDFNDYYGD